MIALSVNLNKIALIRNSRTGDYPSVADFGRAALAAGAHGLTVHPRPDQRHIRPGDVHQLAQIALTEFGAEFNIEGNPFASPRGNYPGLMALVEATRPTQVTLVPDGDGQLTSDHGFDLTKDGDRLRPIITECQRWGARVSLFMDPQVEPMRHARAIGADRIELYTGPYAAAASLGATEQNHSLQSYSAAARAAREAGLGVNAGHDLNLLNLSMFRQQVPELLEVSIGHALTVDALEQGFSAAVRAYLKMLGHTA